MEKKRNEQELSCEQEIIQLKAKLAEQDDEMVFKNEQISVLEETNAELEETIVHQKNEINEKNEQIEKLLSGILELKENQQKLETIISEIETKYKIDLEECAIKKEDYRKNTLDKIEEIKVLEEQITKLKEAIEILNEEIRTLKDEKNNLSNQDKINEIKKAIAYWKAQIEKAQQNKHGKSLIKKYQIKLDEAIKNLEQEERCLK